MKKIYNPFKDQKGYNCFACCPTNPIGLHMEFFEDGDYVCSIWKPKIQFEGYPNVLHGGIQGTLLDEIAAWTVYIKTHTSGVTSRMDIKYHKTVLVRNTELLLRAKILNRRVRFATIHAELMDRNGTVYSDAELVYYLFPQEIARSKYAFPEYSKFFE